METPKAILDKERKEAAIYGAPIKHSLSPACFAIIWKDVDLWFGAFECPSLNDPDSVWHMNIRKASSLGSCLTMPLKLSVIKHLDKITVEAKAMGSVNTTFFSKSPQSSEIEHVGTNTDTSAVRRVLLSVLTGQKTPFHKTTPSMFESGKVAGFILGGGGAARACAYALIRLGVSPILIVNRDEHETTAILRQFPNGGLRGLISAANAQENVKELEDHGINLCIGIGAIPSAKPETQAEKQVFEIMQTLLSKSYTPPTIIPESNNCIPLPQRPCFLEMAYKPLMTISRTMAENNKWQTISGIEVVAEICVSVNRLANSLKSTRSVLNYVNSESVSSSKLSSGQGGVFRPQPDKRYATCCERSNEALAVMHRVHTFVFG